MISRLHKNCMGTTSFDGKFAGMMKAQDFIAYPLPADSDRVRVKIQSDTRIGFIELADGRVLLSKPQASGAYFHHLSGARYVGKLTPEDLLMLKAHIFASAHGAAGKAENGIVQTDNSGALEVFG